MDALAKQDAYLLIGVGLVGIVALWYIKNNAASIGAGAVTAVGDMAGGMASATVQLIASPVVALSNTAPFQAVGNWIGGTVYDITHPSSALNPAVIAPGSASGVTGTW
jgi:hypothetical protein